MKIQQSLFGLLLLHILLPLQASAQQLAFSKPHGFYDQTFSLEISCSQPGLPEHTTIRYTLDGSDPTLSSAAYTQPITVSGNTILRAAVVADTGRVTPVTTATYLFLDDVLNQSNTPEGYPDTWGEYTQMSGTAIADYEMDPEMTTNPTLRAKIKEGLKELPVLSIVSDKDNFFSHENDSVRGGIYIFTGPPVGDATGHGWTRPASIELFGPKGGVDSQEVYNLTANCGIRLHGGHGRLAEKNPKHSFRLVFKKEYGSSSLNYPLFGADEPSTFKQLVLRCHFGNAWQHWGEDNRKRAQYTRDVWARRMQRKMGHTSVNALYVHLFLNGMYWGLYNLAERVNDQFGKDHLGGKKSDVDVIKIEEDGGNHIEAAEGTLDGWNNLVATARAAATSDEAYAQLDTLLDIDQFIDYMLINQYAGNTDWDHHNWYAVRSKGADQKGFRLLCWDSELIFGSSRENVLNTNNGSSFPTGIFNNLLQNEQFARRYVKRARQVLSDDGLLGETSVVQVWDSLYHTIANALYAEAARWGDYRRDVHPYSSRGSLYTVDDTYMSERNRLLNEYFPMRTDYVLSSILNKVNVDEFEPAEDWERLTASMFHQWNGTGGDAQPLDDEVHVEWLVGSNASGGAAVAGFTSVSEFQYADLSNYDKLVIHGTGGTLRILANRLDTNGRPWKELKVTLNENDPYWDSEWQAIIVPLNELKDMRDTNNNDRHDDYLHLNALKVDWSSNVLVRGLYLVPGADITQVDLSQHHVRPMQTVYYNLNGQRLSQPTRKGLYIVNGRKVVVGK